LATIIVPEGIFQNGTLAVYEATLSWQQIGSYEKGCEEGDLKIKVGVKFTNEVKLTVENTNEFKGKGNIFGIEVEYTKGSKEGAEFAEGKEESKEFESTIKKEKNVMLEVFLYQKTVTFKKWKGSKPELVGKKTFKSFDFKEVTCTKKCC
jgi:hypothetical protein